MNQNEQILYAYLTELPSKDKTHQWSFAILLQNIGERLLELDARGEIIPNIMESCSLSKKGNQLRLQIKRSKFFQNGKDLTADHIIETLVNIARENDQHTLFGVALKDQDDIASNFKKSSKHRIEISFRRSISDLMNLLSMIEATILSSNEEPISGSGPWTIQKWTDQCLALKLSESHALASQSFYDQVILKPITDFDSHNPEDAYVIISPGFSRKMPPLNFLNKQVYLNLQHQFSSFFLFKQHHEDLGPLFQIITEKILKKKTHWQRNPSDSFTPEDTALYFQLRRKSQVNKAYEQLNVNLKIIGTQLPQALIDTIKATFQVYKINLSFDEIGTDGWLCIMDTPTPKDSYTVIKHFWRFLISEKISRSDIPGYQYLKKAYHETDLIRRINFYKDFLTSLHRSNKFCPFFKSPLMLISNRMIETANSSYFSFIDVKKSFKEAKDEELRLATLSAIGSAVQMFAHDVKKPFSMIQSFVSLIDGTNDPEKIKQLSQKHLPRIRQTIKRVDGLIYDIVEIGSNSDIIQEPNSLHEIIETCLEEAILFENEKNLSVSRKLLHHSKIDVDAHKIRRVFINILTNAYQACQERGQIWVHSRLTEDDFIQITIGNSGSYIASEQKDKIFDAFYTKGKRHGTGLGLAIAKRIIEGHGGEIWCTSDKKKGTEFFFTVPSTNEIDKPEENLVVKEETQQLDDWQYQPLNIIIADDSKAYLGLMEDIISSIYCPNLTVEYVSTVSDLLKKAKEFKYDLMIVDINFGDSHYDGFYALSKIRKLGIDSLVCLHSDAPVIDYQRRALLSGADMFLPKPITAAHFEKLFQSCQKIQSHQATYWVVDDDPFFLSMWEESDLAVKVFLNPEDLLEQLKFLNEKVEGIIIDFTFENWDGDGMSLAKTIKSSLETPPPLYLCSDRLAIDDRSLFDDILPKDIAGALERLKKAKKRNQQS